MPRPRRDVCAHGHDLTDPANIYTSARNRRQCLTCRRERARAQHARRVERKRLGLSPHDTITAAQADAILERAVADEIAMPWEKQRRKRAAIPQ